MKFNLIAILTTVAILTGCVQTRYVNPNDGATKSFLEINQKAQGAKAVLGLAGESLSVRSVQIAQDSVSWIDVQTSEIRSAATDQLEFVRFVKRDQASSAAGMLVGGIVGGVLGGLFGHSLGDTECQPRGSRSGTTWQSPLIFDWCTEYTAWEMAVAFATVGIVTGGSFGAQAKRRFIYKFEATPRAISPVVASTIRGRAPKLD